jgi:hypothetical protein
VGNAKRCPSPVVNLKGFPSGRHIHQLGSRGVSVRGGLSTGRAFVFYGVQLVFYGVPDVKNEE